MRKQKFVYYQENDMYVGYLEEFPDYMTQGKTLEELELNLIDIYKELTGGRRMKEILFPQTKHRSV